MFVRERVSFKAQCMNKRMGEEGCCAAEISKIEEKINICAYQIKSLKDEYKNLLIKNLEKDVEIRSLKKKIESKKYTSFERKLTKKCIENLQNISDSEKDDSKFISVILNELYDVNILKSKSISGRSKNNKKTPLTPEKKLLLENIYSERLQHLSTSEINTRKKNLSKIIRNTIDGANQKK